MNNLKIYVCYSCDSPVLNEYSADKNTYIPVKCGGYQNSKIQLSDADGDSVSQYNLYINEMSLIWAVGRNFEKFGSPEYLGFAHYRRYLDLSNVKLSPNAIVSYKAVSPMSEYLMYAIYHLKSDLDMFIMEFRRKYSNDAGRILDYFQQPVNYSCNLFIMYKDMFREYFRFIEKCIDVCLFDLFPVLNLDSRDRYQRRALGFILERMTSCWIWDKCRSGAEFKNTRIVEADIKSIYSRQ